MNEDLYQTANQIDAMPCTSKRGANVQPQSSPEVSAVKARSKPKSTFTSAKFQEDDNQVEFEVEQDDLNEEFPSEGEVSDSDPESEVDPSESLDEDRSFTDSQQSDRFGPPITIMNVNELNQTPLLVCTNNNASCKFVTDENSGNDGPTDTDNDNEVVLSQTCKDNAKFEQIELEFRESNKKMEQKIDKLTNALVNVQDLILKNGRNEAKKVKCKSLPPGNVVNRADSAATIYQNALHPINSLQTEAIGINPHAPAKRIRSSSKEETPIDTSDKLLDITCHDHNLEFAAGAV